MICFADTETTGFPRWDRHGDFPGQPYMVSIAALLCTDDGQEVYEMHRLVKPEAWIVPTNATEVHGITTERCRAEGLPLFEVMAEFAKLHEQAEPLTCYGIGFDRKILSGAYRRARLPDLTKTRPDWCAQSTATKFCHMPATDKMIAAGQKGRAKPAKLGEAYRIIFGEELIGAHDALADVRALKRIVFRIRELQREQGAAA
jgi:DNA polymerase III subunit epsilon